MLKNGATRTSYEELEDYKVFCPVDAPDPSLEVTTTTDSPDGTNALNSETPQPPRARAASPPASGHETASVLSTNSDRVPCTRPTCGVVNGKVRKLEGKKHLCR